MNFTNTELIPMFFLIILIFCSEKLPDICKGRSRVINQYIEQIADNYLAPNTNLKGGD